MRALAFITPVALFFLLLLLRYIALRLFGKGVKPARRFRIWQIEEDFLMGSILGIKPGSSGHFHADIIPADGQLQAGAIPSWSASDPSVGLTPSADGLSVDVSVPGDSTLTSFGLTISGVSSDGTAISGSATVPVLQPPPPPATGFDIVQDS